MSGLSPFEKPVFTLSCPPFGEVRAGVCRKITYDRIEIFLKGGGAARVHEIMREILPELKFEDITFSTAFVFLTAYKNAIDEYCERNKDIFEVPERVDFSEEKEKLKLPVVTSAERLVHEHSGLNFAEIKELDILDFKMLLADSVKISILSRMDGKGREYLNECYDCMHQNSSIFG